MVIETIVNGNMVQEDQNRTLVSFEDKLLFILYYVKVYPLHSELTP